MVKNLIQLSIVSLFILLAGGCSHIPVVVNVPDNIGKDGLVVGQLVPGAMMTTDTGLKLSPRISKGTDKARRFDGGIQNSTFTIPLEPGEYNLESVEYSYQDSSHYPRVVSGTVTYPINRKFSVASGKVSNLGLMVFVPNRQDPQKYGISVFDNSVEMQQYLQKNHAPLYGALSDKTIAIAAVDQKEKLGSLLGMDKLNDVRKELINVELIRALNYRKFNAVSFKDKDFSKFVSQSRFDKDNIDSANFLTASLGAIGKIEMNAERKMTGIKILDSNTLDDLDQCVMRGDRALCLLERTQEGGILTRNKSKFQKYLLVQGDKTEIKQLGSSIGENSIWLAGDKQIVYVDAEMNFHASEDNGQTWALLNDFSKIAPKQNISGAFFIKDEDKQGVTSGKDGYYLYTIDRQIVFVPYGKSERIHIPFPQGSEQLTQVFETSAGLHALIANRGLTESTKFQAMLKPAGSQTWEKQGELQPTCREPKYVAGNPLKVACKTASKLVSKDNGYNWTYSAN
jgi:hypothetical protein